MTPIEAATLLNIAQVQLVRLQHSSNPAFDGITSQIRLTMRKVELYLRHGHPGVTGDQAMQCGWCGNVETHFCSKSPAGESV